MTTRISRCRGAVRLSLGFLFLGSSLLAGGADAAIGFTQILVGDAVTAGGGSRSVNWIDADGDGDLDLYVSNGGSPGENNFFYWNNDGTLVADPTSAVANDGTRAVGSSWGDIDNDGDLDLVVTNWYLERSVLYRNEGDGTFSEVTSSPVATPPSYSESATWIDPDGDGDLDLFVANSGNSSAQANFYFENDGSGAFTRILGIDLLSISRYSRHAAWCDADLDGDADVYLANEAGQNNQFYLNELVQTGTADFVANTTDPIVTTGDQSFGACWGDYDNDGDFDLFVANFADEDNSLYENQLVETGSLSFVRNNGSIVSNDGGRSVAGTFADLDNDGDLDLHVTNAFHPNNSTALTNFLYENDGSGNFTKLSEGGLSEVEGWTYGAAFGDYDLDGDLDFFGAGCQANNQDNLFFENDLDGAANWLTVRCEGTASNRTAIGARVSAKAVIDGTPVWQHRFVSSQGSYCGQNLWQHFGLGDATVVDSLVVSWPSGEEQTIEAVGINQVLDVVEPTSVSVDPTPVSEHASVGSWASEFTVSPNPFRESLRVSFRLHEKDSTRFVIRDVNGRLVHESPWENRVAGQHALSWDGSTTSAESAPAGVYYLQLQSRAGAPSTEARVVRVR